MKKIIFTLAIVFSLSNSYCQNLIQNGGFEDELKSWKNFASDGAKANFSIDNNNSNNLKIEIQKLGSNPWDIQSLQSFASVKAKKYILKLKAKAQTNGSKIRVQVQKNTYTSFDFELTSDWKTYTWDFESKEDNLEFAIHYFEKDTFYIDNIEIVEASKEVAEANSITDLISNGDFENGVEGWVNLTENGSNAVFTVNEDSAYEGEKSMRAMVLRFGENPWDIQSVKNFASVAGVRYKLTFMAKADKYGKKLKAQVQNNDEKIYIPKDYILAEKWQEYSWIFRARTDDMQIALIYQDLGLYEIDMLSIKAIPKKKKKKKGKKKKKKN